MAAGLPARGCGGFHRHIAPWRLQSRISARPPARAAGVGKIGPIRFRAPQIPGGPSCLTTPVFLPKTRNLAEGGARGGLSWTSVDNGGNEYVYPAISCNLPAGVGIEYTARQYDEEIGN